MPSRVRTYLTIDILLKKLENHPNALRYLPDEPKTHVAKKYLYTVVNTLDSRFFVEVEREIAAKIPPKAVKAPPNI